MIRKRNFRVGRKKTLNKTPLFGFLKFQKLFSGDRRIALGIVGHIVQRRDGHQRS